MSEINVTGLKELQQFLNTLPAKIEANIMRGALRAGAKPIAEAAKEGAPTGEASDTNKRRYKLYSGALRDSIRVSARIDRRFGQVTAKVVAGGKSRKTGADVFYANFIEYGTKPHSVSRKNKGATNHPGISPKPFMRPAMDGAKEDAVIAAAEYIKRRLSTKHGIDTADIVIGLEE